MSEEPTSSDFDPLLALYPIDNEPKSNVKVYDNVAVFEASLKRQNLGQNAPPKVNRRDKSFSQRKKLATEARNRDLSKLKEMMEARKAMDRAKSGGTEEEEVEKPVQPKPKKILPNLLSYMEKSAVGPMSLLHRAVSNRLRCNVYTRHFNGLRGVLCGFVVVFDRYMNLAMVDVDETFSLAPRGKVAEHQKKLSIAQLEKASDHVRAFGLEGSPATADSKRPSFRHLPTTGAVRVETKPKDPDLQPGGLKEPNARVRLRCDAVKRYNTRNPPKLKDLVFHGGSPQLFHRHINNIYVRGNSVVLVALAS